MKAGCRVLISAAVLSLVAGPRGTVEAATTEPVGAMLVGIKGDNGMNIIGTGGFTRAPEWAGTGEVTAPTAFEDPSAGWTGNAYSGTHYIQLESGEWAAIAANTATSLTLESSLSTGAGQAYRIIPFHTLASLFGEQNEAGFTGGSDITGADMLLVWDAPAQEYGGVYYYNSSRTRWEDGGNNPAAQAILYPDECLIIIGRSDKDILLNGTVPTGTSGGFLAGGDNVTVLPNPFPVDMPVASSNFEAFLAGGPHAGEADWLLLWDAVNQEYGELYYFDTDDSLWKDGDNYPVTNEDVIPAGGGVIVLKFSSGDASWYLNAPYTID